MKNILNKVLSFMKDNLWFIIACVLIIVLGTVKLPYEIETPGGVIPLNDRVMVDGEYFDMEGSYNLTYVTVVQSTIMNYIIAKINPQWEIIPQSETLYENETTEDGFKRDQLYLEQSKDYATIVGLQAAGIEYEIQNKVNYVAYIDPKSDNEIKIGDNILSCDGESVVDLNAFKDIVQSHDIGDELTFTVIRDGKEVDVKARVYEDDGNKYIGVALITTFDVISDMDVQISSKASEAGPSGGLMMSLMVYSSVTKKDLTNGDIIAGTGTIDLDGNVGEIGGVDFKVRGASKAGAKVFLTPKENYEEAKETAERDNLKIEIVEVETINDAIEYLENRISKN